LTARFKLLSLTGALGLELQHRTGSAAVRVDEIGAAARETMESKNPKTIWKRGTNQKAKLKRASI